MEELSKVRVMVKSLVPGTVVYNNPLRHVRRVWSKRNQVIVIPADELQESIYDIGVYNLFHQGYLGIENAEHRKLIGLDNDSFGVNIPFSDADAQKLLGDETKLDAFKAKIATLQPGSIELLTSVAFEMRNVSYDKVTAMKEILGVNITNMLKNDEEPVQTK